MDMGAAFIKSVKNNAPDAAICIDPFHVVQLATNSGMAAFMKAAATVRGHMEGIYQAVTRKISNGKHEGLNNKIRTMTRRSYGFHSPEAVLALIMLACGPVTVRLPYQK